jgi:plastocyanin
MEPFVHIRRIAAFTTLATAAVLAGCSSESTSTATPPPVTAAPTTISVAAPESVPEETTAPIVADGPTLTILDFAFSPAAVAAGEELTIINSDEFPHTVTDSGGAFVARLDGRATQTITIDAAGTYDIVCEIHPSMTGTIVVS